MSAKQQLCGLGLLASLILMCVFSEGFGIWAVLGAVSVAFLSLSYMPRRVRSKVVIGFLIGMIAMLALSMAGGVYYYYDQSRLQNQYAAK